MHPFGPTAGVIRVKNKCHTCLLHRCPLKQRCVFIVFLFVLGSSEMAEYRSAAGTRPLHRRTGGGRRRGAESVGQRAFPEGRQAQTSGRMRVRFFILLFLRFTHSIRRSSPIVGSWINWSHEISFEVHFSLFRHKLLADFLVFYIFWVFLLSNNITPFVFQWRSVTFLEQFSTDWQNYLFVYWIPYWPPGQQQQQSF